MTPSSGANSSTGRPPPAPPHHTQTGRTTYAAIPNQKEAVYHMNSFITAKAAMTQNPPTTTTTMTAHKATMNNPTAPDSKPPATPVDERRLDFKVRFQYTWEKLS